MYQEYKKEAVELVANSTYETFRLQESSFIYDRQGEVIAKLTKDEDSQYLPYDSIPENAINAFVAIEDRTFWENSGFDLRGIIRVALNYFKTEGEEVHGASTITQQLARNRFLTREVSIERKAKEILYSGDVVLRRCGSRTSYSPSSYGMGSSFGSRLDIPSSTSRKLIGR